MRVHRKRGREREGTRDADASVYPVLYCVT